MESKLLKSKDWRSIIDPPTKCRECEHCKWPERVCVKLNIKIRDTDKKGCEVCEPKQK